MNAVRWIVCLFVVSISNVQSAKEFNGKITSYYNDVREGGGKYSLDYENKVIKFNHAVDVMLKVMNEISALMGLTVPIPDIKHTFGKGRMAGDFSASQGHFKDLSSLQRTGDVQLTIGEGSVSAEISLGLGILDAGYQRFAFDIVKIHQNGTINISILKNSLKMKLTFTLLPVCKVNVDNLELDVLDGIDVQITGLGAFQSMFEILSKWIINNFTVSLRKIINLKLIESAEKAIAKQDLCKYIPKL